MAAAFRRTFQRRTKRNSSSALAEIPAESSVAVRCRLITKGIRGRRRARLFTNQSGTLHRSNMAILSKQQMSTQHLIMQGDMAEVVFQLKKKKGRKKRATTRESGECLCAECFFSFHKGSEITPMTTAGN